MTLKELAKLANVSVATASKALSGSAELHPDTINTVLRIAERCGYFSDKKRRRVSAPSYTAPTVAVVCPEIISPYYATLVTGIAQALEERQANAIVYYTDFSDARKRDILNRCLRNADVSGVVLICKNEEPPPFPTVTFAENGDVVADIEKTVDCALRALLVREHRRIAYIGEEKTRAKRDAFLKLAEEYGIKDTVLSVTAEGRFEEAGANAAERLLSMPDLPTAVLAAYDEIALGAMAVFMKRGIRIPEQTAFVGLNNITAAKYFPIPLASVYYDQRETAVCLADGILQKIRGESPLPVTPSLRLAERESLGGNI